MNKIHTNNKVFNMVLSKKSTEKTLISSNLTLKFFSSLCLDSLPDFWAMKIEAGFGGSSFADGLAAGALVVDFFWNDLEIINY